jgi:hypothetical protein
LLYIAIPLSHFGPKVLAVAAQQLSDPNQEPVHDKRQPNQKKDATIVPANSSLQPDHWKEVVQKRIMDKTKIISKVLR